MEHHDYEDVRQPPERRGPRHRHETSTVAGPATKWELENHGVYQSFSHPDGWWGHCNGWSSYTTTEPGGAPKRDIWVREAQNGPVDPFAPPGPVELVECAPGEDGCLLFRMGDIEALPSEIHFNDSASTAGRRCDSAADTMARDEFGRPLDPACRDLNPGAFHIGITGLLNRGAPHLGSNTPGRPAFVIDYNADYQVWNFPLTKYEISEQEELTAEQAAALLGASDYVFNDAAERFVRVRMSYWMVSDSVKGEAMLLYAHDRPIDPHQVELNYVLELDADGNILGGEWLDDPSTDGGPDNQRLHPDFFWMASGHAGYGENGDDLGGDDDNPYIAYSKVKALLNCANDPATCSGAPITDPEPIGTGPDPQPEPEPDPQPEPEPEPQPEPDPTPDPDPPAPSAGSCVGHCSSTAPVPNSTPACYCDSWCSILGTCCDDYWDACF